MNRSTSADSGEPYEDAPMIPTNSAMADLTDTNADDEEDDDMDYEPSTEDGSEDGLHEFIEQLIEEDDEEDEDDDDEEEFHDAEGGYSTIEVQIDEDEDEQTETEGAQATTAHAHVRREQILRLLASSQIGRLFLRGAENDEDDFATFSIRRRRRSPRLDPNRFPKVPSDEGAKLMNSGDFGTNEIQAISTISQKKNLARRILDRELGMDGGARQKANQKLMTQGMIPSSNADVIIHYDQPVYSGQFSDDGNFFFSCVKDYRVRMYDTSNPYKWRYYKTVDYPFGQWTLTDASLSPDNKYLAYTSIRPKVCLAPTDPNDMGDPYDLDLSDNGRRGRIGGFRSRHDSFGIWSIRFSGDGRELVAGTSANSIVVYDIESRRSVLEIAGHEDDVNAVCFGDTSSPHILYSGSDDTTLKVWDRRSMGDSREAGAFVGHTEGLTYIDSKGDGRYILSNGKDQSMKLWDLRMVMTTARFAEIDTRLYTTNFDYRWGTYDEDDWAPHPYDNSLVTFRGHKVLRTLIRCHFSPAGSTNSRYVYSGSEDGKVYVYNLDATLAGKVDVFAATKDTRPYDMVMMDEFPYDDGSRHSRWKTCVRDASWHPNAPVIAASAWNGYGMSGGSVTVHSWNDGAEDDEAEPKMGLRVDDKLQYDPSLYSLPRRSRYTTLGQRGGLRATTRLDDDDD